VRRALNENIECSLVFLGVGQEESVLREQARKYGIEDRVLFMGYALNVLDYMAASDVLIHPSLLESSCVVVKEASLVGLPVIVCKGIGDFDDYMKNNENGIVVERENFVDEALVALRGYQSDRERYRQMGVNLRADIISRFHIDMTIDRYYGLIDA